MGRGLMVSMGWMVGAALLACVGTAGAAAHDLDDAGLRQAMEANHALAAYVKRNGMPDVAESRFLSDKPPWDRDEIALYYFDAHKEISFARAVILGEPSIQLEHFERRLSDADVQKLRPRAQTYGGAAEYASTSSDPTDRAEAAAQRAEAAAGRVEAAADAADRAAARAEAIVAKREAAFHRKLKK